MILSILIYMRSMKRSGDLVALNSVLMLLPCHCLGVTYRASTALQNINKTKRLRAAEDQFESKRQAVIDGVAL